VGPGRQGTRGRAGVRLSGDVRAVSWAAAWGVSGPRATRSENRQAERGARERAAGCGASRESRCNTRFIKGHKPSNHIRARIKSHVYTTE